MTKASVAAVLGVLLGAIPAAVAAQDVPSVVPRPIQFGPEVALGSGGWDLAVGGRVVYPGLGKMVTVNGLEAYGSWDLHFPEGGNMWEANANATYNVTLAGVPKLSPYVGGGLSYIHGSGAGDLGFNVLGGARFTLASKFHAFAEARIAFHDDSHLVATFGVLF